VATSANRSSYGFENPSIHPRDPGSPADVYEIRASKNKRGANLISDALPFDRLCYGGTNAASNAMYNNHSHDAVIRV
jgi:hypothetical protein